MVTTTKAALHPENETRMLSLEIDDSEEQTRRVLKKLAQTTGKNLKPDDSIHYDWQDFQRLLRMIGNKNVAVPFADALADLDPAEGDAPAAGLLADHCLHQEPRSDPLLPAQEQREGRTRR